MMVSPPTAQQRGAVGQATAVVPGMPLGRGSEFQVAPPFEVTTTSARPDRKLPAATHSLVVGHDTENIWPEPGGSASLAQAAPPSWVAATAPGPFADPTAQQSETVGHDTAAGPMKLGGKDSWDHWEPSSVVNRTVPGTVKSGLSPVTQQSEMVGQDSPVSTEGPSGTGSAVQVDARLAVATTSPIPVPSKPAAQQSDADGQATPATHSAFGMPPPAVQLVPPSEVA